MITRTAGIVAGVMMTVIFSCTILPVSAHANILKGFSTALKQLQALHTLCWLPLSHVKECHIDEATHLAGVQGEPEDEELVKGLSNLELHEDGRVKDAEETVVEVGFTLSFLCISGTCRLPIHVAVQMQQWPESESANDSSTSHYVKAAYREFICRSMQGRKRVFHMAHSIRTDFPRTCRGE
jgi:hypothetical protein